MNQKDPHGFYSVFGTDPGLSRFETMGNCGFNPKLRGSQNELI
jgi:hypothetical protein